MKNHDICVSCLYFFNDRQRPPMLSHRALHRLRLSSRAPAAPVFVIFGIFSACVCHLRHLQRLCLSSPASSASVFAIFDICSAHTCHSEPQRPPFLGPLHGLPMFPASLRLVPDEQRRDPACGGCAEISGRVIHAALAPPGAEGDPGGLSFGGWDVDLIRPSGEAEFA